MISTATALASSATIEDGITPVSSDTLSIPTVNFAEYIENARCTREEQSAGRLEQGRSTQEHGLPIVYPTVKERTSSFLDDFERWTRFPFWRRYNSGSPRSGTGLRIRRSSSSNPHNSTNRTASWIAVFFLINTACYDATTTIVAIPSSGFGIGISLELALSAASYFASWSLWQLFLGLDSYRFPVKTYGDIAERIYGKSVGRIVFVIQSIDIFLATGVNMISGAYELLAALINTRDDSVTSFCFPVLCLLITIGAICITEVRPLDSFRWVALLSFVASVIAFGGNLVLSTWVDAVMQYLRRYYSHELPLEPVKRVFGYPGGWGPYVRYGVPPWAWALNRISVSYWGNTVFTEFMAEMKDAADFGAALRWAWIWFVVQRLVLGISFYVQQGQYAELDPIILALQGSGSDNKKVVAMSHWLRAMILIMQAALQANIALKVILRGALSKLNSVTIWNVRRVAFLWAIVVPIYWISSYLVAMCLPLYGFWSEVYFSIGWGFAAYGLPPLLYIGFCAKMYKLVPRTSVQTSRRNAVDLEPTNPWLSEPMLQRARIGLAVIVILVALLVTGVSTWQTILGLVAFVKLPAGFWKPRICNCVAF